MIVTQQLLPTTRKTPLLTDKSTFFPLPTKVCDVLSHVCPITTAPICLSTSRTPLLQWPWWPPARRNIIDRSLAALLLYFPVVKHPHGTWREAQYYIALAIAAREGNTMQRQCLPTGKSFLKRSFIWLGLCPVIWQLCRIDELLVRSNAEKKDVGHFELRTVHSFRNIKPTFPTTYRTPHTTYYDRNLDRIIYPHQQRPFPPSQNTHTHTHTHTHT